MTNGAAPSESVWNAMYIPADDRPIKEYYVRLPREAIQHLYSLYLPWWIMHLEPKLQCYPEMAHMSLGLIKAVHTAGERYLMFICTGTAYNTKAYSFLSPSSRRGALIYGNAVILTPVAATRL